MRDQILEQRTDNRSRFTIILNGFSRYAWQHNAVARRRAFSLTFFAAGFKVAVFVLRDQLSHQLSYGPALRSLRRAVSVFTAVAVVKSDCSSLPQDMVLPENDFPSLKKQHQPYRVLIWRLAAPRCCSIRQGLDQLARDDYYTMFSHIGLCAAHFSRARGADS